MRCCNRLRRERNEWEGGITGSLYLHIPRVIPLSAARGVSQLWLRVIYVLAHAGWKRHPWVWQVSRLCHIKLTNFSGGSNKAPSWTSGRWSHVAKVVTTVQNMKSFICISRLVCLFLPQGERRDKTKGRRISSRGRARYKTFARSPQSKSKGLLKNTVISINNLTLWSSSAFGYITSNISEITVYKWCGTVSVKQLILIKLISPLDISFMYSLCFVAPYIFFSLIV